MDSEPSFGTRLLRAIRNLFILTVVVGCAGAAVYALSMVNARTFTVEVQNGRLVVLKGKMMQSDVAFFLARTRLDDARRQLEEALVQLKLAAESDSKSKAQASLMLLAVEPQVKLLSTTLRATNVTADGTNTLSKVLEPQLQKM